MRAVPYQQETAEAPVMESTRSGHCSGYIYKIKYKTLYHTVFNVSYGFISLLYINYCFSL